MNSLGHSWEGYVIEQIAHKLDSETQYSLIKKLPLRRLCGGKETIIEPP